MKNIEIKVISLIVIFINLLTLLTICKMHIKEISIRQGYFEIVFTQIILETLFNLTIFVIIIISMIKEPINESYFYFISLLFDIFFNVDIIYNIQTILKLIQAKNKVESEDIFINNEDDSGSVGRCGSNASIDLKRHSFRRIHLVSFLFSIIHSIIYFFVILKDDKNEKNELNWFFYFIDKQQKNLWLLLLFIFNYIYLGLSIRYCLLRQQINESIKLKHYSIYSFITSLASLIFPLRILLNEVIRNNDKKDDKELQYIFCFIFLLFYLYKNVYFRLNCYYVQYILSKKGNKFLKKLEFGLQILFTRIKISSPNFIDFNNSFLYHSLSREKDFDVKKDKKRKKGNINNEDIENSKSYSFTGN